jgi:hypothetical protein
VSKECAGEVRALRELTDGSKPCVPVSACLPVHFHLGALRASLCVSRCAPSSLSTRMCLMALVHLCMSQRQTRSLV